MLFTHLLMVALPRRRPPQLDEPVGPATYGFEVKTQKLFLGQHFAHVESGCCHTWAAFEKSSWADFPAVSGANRGAGPSSGEEFVVGTFDNLHYGRVF